MLRNRDVMKLDAIEISQGFSILVIADYQWNGAVKFSGLLPMQQIGQAVQVLRHEDGHLQPLGLKLQPPTHPEIRGHDAKLVPKHGQIKTVERPFHAHEKQAGLLVLVLVRVRYVGTVAIEKARDARY